MHRKTVMEDDQTSDLAASTAGGEARFEAEISMDRG
jgi:hypothetical protein